MDNYIEILKKRFDLFGEGSRWVYYYPRTRDGWKTAGNIEIVKPRSSATSKDWAQYFRKLENNAPSYHEARIAEITSHVCVAKRLFGIGTTSYGLEKTKWLALEADLDEQDSVESFSDVRSKLLREDRIEELRSKGIKVHVMWTGNRSLHLQLFFKLPLPIELVRKGYLGLLNGCFKKEADACSLDKGMRLPGSIHRKTRRIATYENCESLEDIIKYLSDDSILCEDINNNEQLIDCRTSSPVKKGDCLATENNKTNEQLIDCRTSFEDMIVHPGQFQDFVTRKVFALLARHGKSTETINALKRVVSRGVQEHSKLRDRLKRLNHAISKFNENVREKKPMDLNNIELTTRRYILNSAWMNADVRRLKFAEKLVEIARYMTARIMQGYKAIGVRELVDVMNMPEGHASNIQVNYWKNFICTTIDSSMRVKRASIPMFKQTELAYQGKVARWELESEIRKGLEMKENNDE